MIGKLKEALLRIMGKRNEAQRETEFLGFEAFSRPMVRLRVASPEGRAAEVERPADKQPPRRKAA